jgi:hypothetical protein
LSPRGTAIAVADEVEVGQVATLQLRSVPDGGILQSWEVGNYNLSRAYWSPDGRHLVAIGQVPVLDDSQYFPWQRLYTLFLFPVEPSLAGTLEEREVAVPPELTWAQYSDPALGFAVQYPGDWAVAASPGADDGSGRSWFTVEFQSNLHAYDHQAFDMYTICVAVAEGARGTLTEAVDDTLRPVFAPVRDQVQRYCCRTVDGELAVELSGFPPGRWGSRQVVVLHEGREYWLTFTPQVGLNGITSADAIGRAAFSTFLRTFAFVPITVTPLPSAPTVTPVPTPS